jgi:predicted RNA polymerase sigma factor
MDTTINHAVNTAQANSAAVGMAVLKKANEVDADTAMQLVAASSANLPAHLGRNINTTA